MDKIKALIYKYLEVNYGYSPEELSDDMPLYSSGLLTSLMLLKMIAQLEKTIGVNVNTNNFAQNDVDSIEKLTLFFNRQNLL
ncbi:MAG: acyl carrier protein [Coxiellaceae bacterium]|nr:acyl carrier protein [Coxiellaceae bacterium]